MINVAVVNRTPPTLIITFNRSVTLSEFAHVSIRVGETPLATPSWSMSVGEVANDKPASMWACPLGDLMEDDEVPITLSCDPQHVVFTLQPGHHMACCNSKTF